ncbi:hypothetical protein C5S35_15810 [Candidatus Methanophagaceae archaeon]|jgi:hypothetical protein|nr:hypothetical protein C5S35_15810 [Methanophagales archaeon]
MSHSGNIPATKGMEGHVVEKTGLNGGIQVVRIGIH